MNSIIGARGQQSITSCLWRRGLRLFAVTSLLAGALALTAPAAVAADGPTLQDISFGALPGDRVQLVLTGSAPLGEPGSFSTDSPARIALDFPGVSSGLAQKTQTIGVGMARSVTTVEAAGRTRVVINLVAPVGYEITSQGNQTLVTLGGAGPAMVSSAPAAPAAAAKVASRRIDAIDFRRGDESAGRILVTLSDPSTSVDVQEEGGRIVISFLDTTLPDRLERRLDVTDFATPVKTVETVARGGDVRMTVIPEGEYEHLAYQANELFALELRPLTKEEKDAIRKREKKFTGERLSLNFQDIEVRAVLQLLADFTDLNMVTSDTVSGNITLRLKNVPWDQALDIILKTKGLSMRQTDNVILVAPTAEIVAREQLELESQNKIEELAPLYAEYIEVNYAKASDLAALLKSPDNQLLSERGNVTVDERTNTLLVQDTAAKLEDIRRLIAKLDIPVRQVLIESRIVFANDNFTKNLGVKFGFSGALDTDNTDFFVFGGGQEGDFNLPGNIVEVPAGSGNESLIVDLPAAGAAGSFNFFLGRIADHLLRLELSALQQEGNGEIIASPRLVTSDQTTATIEAGEQIPYQEASSSGATSTSFQDATLKLDVTPHITPNDKVMLELEVNQDSAGEVPQGATAPSINTRSINTSVLVDNGETVVLGGIYNHSRNETETKVPLFGDLPYVGFLFRNSSQTNNRNELLIFVTPKILKDT